MAQIRDKKGFVTGCCPVGKDIKVRRTRAAGFDVNVQRIYFAGNTSLKKKKRLELGTQGIFYLMHQL